MLNFHKPYFSPHVSWSEVLVHSPEMSVQFRFLFLLFPLLVSSATLIADVNNSDAAFYYVLDPSESTNFVISSPRSVISDLTGNTAEDVFDSESSYKSSQMIADYDYFDISSIPRNSEDFYFSSDSDGDDERDLSFTFTDSETPFSMLPNENVNMSNILIDSEETENHNINDIYSLNLDNDPDLFQCLVSNIITVNPDDPHYVDTNSIILEYIIYNDDPSMISHNPEDNHNFEMSSINLEDRGEYLSEIPVPESLDDHPHFLDTSSMDYFDEDLSMIQADATDEHDISGLDPLDLNDDPFQVENISDIETNEQDDTHFISSDVSGFEL